MSESDSPSRDSTLRSRAWRWRVCGVLLPAIVLLALTPTILAKTRLRDWILNAAVAGDSFHVSTRQASFGYLTPLVIRGFRLQALDGSLRFDMELMESDRSWLSMLISGDDLGNFRFGDPIVNVVTGIATPEETDESPEDDSDNQYAKSLPTLVAQINGAGVQVRNVEQQEPVLDLQGIDFVIRIEQSSIGTVFKIDPTTILDEEMLTPELCSHGVQLIAPMLSDVLDVQGRISCRIDQFSVPVGEPANRRELSEIEGTVTLSDVSVGLNNEITQQLMPLLTRISAVDGPMAMTVSQSTEVNVRVTRGRVHHRGLMFLLPVADSSFEINSSGSVGFDETLDLQLAVSLPDALLGDSRLAKFLRGAPIVIHVGGTVDQPEIGLKPTDDWTGRLGQILDSIRAGEHPGTDPPAEGEDQTVGGVAETVLDAVGDLLDDSDGDERLLPILRERIRDRREREGNERPRILPRRRQPSDSEVPEPATTRL